MRTYQGNLPSDELGYKNIAEAVHDGINWLLFAKGSPCGQWVNLKLVASEPVPSKANYWFGYHPAGDRFNGHKDYKKLKENRPELFSEVCKILALIYREAA